MTDGDDEPADAPEEPAAGDEPDASEEPAEAEEAAEGSPEATAEASGDESSEGLSGDALVEDFRKRLREIADDVEAAETEADLDDLDERLDEIEAELEEADIPEPEEPEDEDEEVEDPREDLGNTIQDLEDDIDGQRGPYGEDVVSGIESSRDTVEETRWVESGQEDVPVAIEAFLDTLNGELGTDISRDGTDESERETGADREDEGEDVDPSALDAAADAVEDAELDADADAETIQSLLDAIDELDGALDDAKDFGDFTTREKLDYEGFYDVLGEKFKDFPPEWSALKEWTKRDNAEMVALYLEQMGAAQHVERNAKEAMKRMGNPAGLDAMKEKAQRRDKPAVEAIGKMGVVEGLDAVRDYIDADSNPALQKTALKAVGEIGDDDVTQDVADQLDAENEGVRGQAARALGLLGDTRAIEPLGAVLADDSEAGPVRASAAWALVQIGTEDALETAATYADERSVLVQHEAKRAEEQLA